MTPHDIAQALHREGRLAEAEAAYRAIVQAAPEDFRALHMLGVLAGQQGKAAAAEQLMAAAVAANPRYAEGHCDRGAALMALKRPDTALASFDAALALDPASLPALANKGSALLDLGRAAEALACFEGALALRGDIAVLWSNHGNALARLARAGDAIASYDRALQLLPGLASAVDGRAKCLRTLGQEVAALAGFRELVRLAPSYPEALGNLLGMQARCADWAGFPETAALVTAAVRAGKPAQSPRGFLLHAPAPEDQMLCAKIHAAGRFAGVDGWQGSGSASTDESARIRVAYVSSDFRDHIVGQLIAGLIERHDRGRFEIVGLSHGRNDESAERKRLERAFDRFVDLHGVGDADAVAAARALDLDVAVDLSGYTEGERARLFAQRIAPVQVGYLGYPGTLGAPLLDYIIGDAHVIPAGHEEFYAERVVRLPETFFATDFALGPAAAIAPTAPSRQDSGLPDDGFVFACFNHVSKITPGLFDLWMGLLRATPRAVLWLRSDSVTAQENLRAEAQARGVDPARLVFAGRAPLDQHLARHACADLFLDTWPYNAHGTAAHALWAGLPLVTLSGGGFAGRVSESLLNAVGLPELVTRSADDYMALAQRLAGDPDSVKALREKLRRARSTAPLFDADRQARALERAFAAMTARARAGKAPEAFTA